MPRAKKSKSKAKKPRAKPKPKPRAKLKSRPKAKPKSRPKSKPKAKPKAAKKAAVGKITHFFPKISVAVVEVLKVLRQGDKIKIAGHGNESEQKIASMQIEYKKVKEAKKGQSIGLKVKKSVKEGDLVYKI